MSKNNVDILIEGYAHSGPNGSYIASPSTILIRTEAKKILVDPGANPERLLTALDKRSLKPNDISFLFLTHYHMDHVLNIRLFPNKDIYDGGVLWRNDEEFFHQKFLPNTGIEILPTPGHSPEHASLLVETDKGIVCIAQDVFWWEDGQQKSDTEKDLLELKDPFASDEEALLDSRKLVLSHADWIIPGHGKMFRNPCNN